MAEIEEGEIFDEHEFRHHRNKNTEYRKQGQRKNNTMNNAQPQNHHEKKFWTNMKQIFGINNSKQDQKKWVRPNNQRDAKTQIKGKPDAPVNQRKSPRQQTPKKSPFQQHAKQQNQFQPKSNRGRPKPNKRSAFWTRHIRGKRNKRNQPVQSHFMKSPFNDFPSSTVDANTFESEEHDLDELQLRLEALKTSIQHINHSWCDDSYASISSNQEFTPHSHSVSGIMNDYNDTSWQNSWNTRLNQTSYDFRSSRNTPDTGRPISAAEWQKQQRMKILQLKDPREQYQEFVKMMFTPRSEILRQQELEQQKINQSMGQSTSDGIFRPLRPSLLPLPDGPDGPIDFEQRQRETTPLSGQDLFYSRDNHSVKTMDFASEYSDQSDKESRLDLPLWDDNPTFVHDFRPTSSCSSNSRAASSRAASRFQQMATPMFTHPDDAKYIFIDTNEFGDVDLRPNRLPPPPLPPPFLFDKTSAFFNFNRPASPLLLFGNSTPHSQSAYSSDWPKTNCENLSNISKSNSSISLFEAVEPLAADSVNDERACTISPEEIPPAAILENKEPETEDQKKNSNDVDDDDDEMAALREVVLRSMKNKKSQPKPPMLMSPKVSMPTSEMQNSSGQVKNLNNSSSNSNVTMKDQKNQVPASTTKRKRTSLNDFIVQKSNIRSPTPSGAPDVGSPSKTKKLKSPRNDDLPSSTKISKSDGASKQDAQSVPRGSDLVVTIASTSQHPPNNQDIPETEPTITPLLTISKKLQSNNKLTNLANLHSIKKTITNSPNKFPPLQRTIANDNLPRVPSRNNLASPFSLDRRNLVQVKRSVNTTTSSLAANLEPVIIYFDEESESEEHNATTGATAANSDSIVAKNDAMPTNSTAPFEIPETSKSANQGYLDKAAVTAMLNERIQQCTIDMLRHKKFVNEDKTRLKTLVSSAFKRKSDLRVTEKKLQKLKEETKNAETDCAELRAFILRINKEIQSVQSRVDRNLEMQMIYQRQWKEIEGLLPKDSLRSKVKTVKARRISKIDQSARRRLKSKTKSRASEDSNTASTSCSAQKLDEIIYFDELASANRDSTLAEANVISRQEPAIQQDKLTESSSFIDSSPLARFRNYRFNDYFLQSFGQLLSSTFYRNKIEPSGVLCPFALNGSCFDAECSWQHECDYKLSEVESIAELLAYCPTLINYRNDGEYIISCARDLYDRLKNCMTLQEILEECVRQIVESRRNDPRSVLDVPCWKPSQIVSANSRLSLDFSAFSTLTASKCVNIPAIDLTSDSPLRYFSCKYYEDELAVDPHNVKMWIQWSQVVLHTFGDKKDQSIIYSLKILCDGLEKNRSDPELWVAYLDAYQRQPDIHLKPNFELVVRSSLQFAPCFQLAWKLWDQVEKLKTTIPSNVQEPKMLDDENDQTCFDKCLEFLTKETSENWSFKVLCCVLRFVKSLLDKGDVDKAKEIVKIPNRQFAIPWSFKNDQMIVASNENKDQTTSAEMLEIIDRCLDKYSSRYKRLNNNNNNNTINAENGPALSNLIDTPKFKNDTVNNISFNDNRKLLEDTWMLHLNRISLQVHLDRIQAAVRYCDSLLCVCDGYFDELYIISRYLKDAS